MTSNNPTQATDQVLTYEEMLSIVFEQFKKEKEEKK